MNEDEAIRILQGLRLEKNMEMNSTNILKERFAEQQAAISMAIAALEKQVTKKVINPHIALSEDEKALLGEDTLYGECPNCEETNCQLWNENNCGECSQALKWKD